MTGLAAGNIAERNQLSAIVGVERLVSEGDDNAIHARIGREPGELPEVDGLRPVSYTHLDVYKRQL